MIKNMSREKRAGDTVCRMMNTPEQHHVQKHLDTNAMDCLFTAFSEHCGIFQIFAVS
jgi:hypothetical protein